MEVVTVLRTLPPVVDTSTVPTELTTLHAAVHANSLDTTPLTVNLFEVTNFEPLATDEPLIEITAALAGTTCNNTYVLADRESFRTTNVILLVVLKADASAEYTATTDPETNRTPQSLPTTGDVLLQCHWYDNPKPA
jgi:hypothetical protein